MTSSQSLPNQSQLVSDIARLIAADRESGWSYFEYRTRMLSSYMQDEVVVATPSGTSEEFPPDGLTSLVRELRRVMYRPGVATWFQASVRVTAEGTVDADFDYDNEPDWHRPVDPQWYAQDLERFPRTDSATPVWLRQRMAESS